MDSHGGESGVDGMTRREALKKGALVAGAAVWVVPAFEALTISQASAATPSGGPDGDDKDKQKKKQRQRGR